MASNSRSGIRHEVAPVTRYHDEFISDPEHTENDVDEIDEDGSHDTRKNSARVRIHDAESAPGFITGSPSSSRPSSDMTCQGIGGKAFLVPAATPYFHFDLTAAVRAAEIEPVNRSPTSCSMYEDTKDVA